MIRKVNNAKRRSTRVKKSKRRPMGSWAQGSSIVTMTGPYLIDNVYLVYLLFAFCSFLLCYW